MRKRHREKRPARLEEQRASLPRILVVCEGLITEKEYIVGFAKSCRNPRVDVDIHPGIGTPVTIVEYARDRRLEAIEQASRERDSNLEYDEVWCVFDIDDHPNVPRAKQQARDNGLELAISNPCIELWLILHFREQPGAQERNKLSNILKSFVPHYNKHVDFEHYKNGYIDASRRSQNLEHEAILDRDDGRNPTTGVWRLTESIRKA